MKTDKMIFLFAKLFLGLPMILFGLNKFLGFISVDPPADPTAQTFLGTMFTSYLFKLVGITEIVGGVMVLIPRTAFVGFLLLLPVITNIVVFHLTHDLPGNGIWLFPMAMQLIVLYFFRDQLKNLIA